MYNYTIISKYRIWTWHHNSHKILPSLFDMSKSTDRMANSADPDQTAPVGAV